MNLMTRCEGRITDFLYNTKSPITVEPEQGLFNQRCFLNAVEYASNSSDPCDVVEVLYIERDRVYLHYVCFKNGKYLEVTLGHRAPHLIYFEIRTIPHEDWPVIDRVFEASMDYWTRAYSSWWERLLGQFDRLV